MIWKYKNWWLENGMFKIEIIEVLHIMLMTLTKWLPRMANKIIAAEIKEMSNAGVIFMYLIICHIMTGDSEREGTMEEQVMTRRDNT